MMTKFLILIALALSQVVFADQGKEWMKLVQGDSQLSELSIPGSHDSCALYGGVYGRCQTMSLREQLDAGVRFVDIRCRAIEDRFQIHHGMIDQKITFAEVRDQCEAFLRANPSECVLMSVKEEYVAKANTRSFGETFADYLKGHEAFWYLDKSVPTLEKARGKIVLIHRHRELPGIPWDSLCVQDHFKVSGEKQIARKWKQVVAQFSAAKVDQTQTLHINFCSGASVWSPPNVVSKVINSHLENYMQQASRRKLGVVVMDFPSRSLIELIYRSNDGAFVD